MESIIGNPNQLASKKTPPGAASMYATSTSSSTTTATGTRHKNDKTTCASSYHAAWLHWTAFEVALLLLLVLMVAGLIAYIQYFNVFGLLKEAFWEEEAAMATMAAIITMPASTKSASQTIPTIIPAAPKAPLIVPATMPLSQSGSTPCLVLSPPSVLQFIVVNVDGSLARYSQVKSFWKSTGLAQFEVIQGVSVSSQSFFRSEIPRLALSAFEFGKALSHREAWKMIARLPSDWGIVLEDHVYPGSPQSFMNLSGIPAICDHVYLESGLGAGETRLRAVCGLQHISLVESGSGMAAYMLSKTQAHRLLELTRNGFDMAVDKFLITRTHRCMLRGDFVQEMPHRNSNVEASVEIMKSRWSSLK